MNETKPIVAVTRKIPDAGLKLFGDRYTVRVGNKVRGLPPREFLALVKDASAILALLTDKIDAKILDAAGKKLKIVANYAVGFDNIDLAAAKKRKITVTNTPAVLTEAVAEHAIALALGVARRLAESDQFLRGVPRLGAGAPFGSGAAGEDFRYRRTGTHRLARRGDCSPGFADESGLLRSG